MSVGYSLDLASLAAAYASGGEMPLRHFGSFVAGISPPLVIGTLELEDGESVKGFLCEPYAIEGPRDITSFGGWRRYAGTRRVA